MDTCKEEGCVYYGSVQHSGYHPERQSREEKKAPRRVPGKF